MHPFISLGRRILLDSWQVMMTVGLVSGSMVALIAMKRDIGWGKALILIIVMIWGALFGAHLAHIILHWDIYQGKHLQGFFIFWKDGHSFFGALGFCALLLLVSSLIIPDIDFWSVADAFALGTPLGMVFARVGCYMKGCCWGTPIAEGHIFYGLSRKLINNQILALHPVQLYSATAALSIFLFVLLMRRKQKIPGIMTGTFLLLYAVARFFLDFFRGDTAGRSLLGFLSIHQEICLLLFPASALLLFFRLRKPAGSS